MKAAPAVQRKLLDLAEIDAELNRANHRRRTLPELDEIGKAESDLRTKRDALVATQTAHGDIDRDISRLESEIEQVRARDRRDRELLDSGELVNPKQIENVQHELETLARRIGTLEDELLEAMERREALETDLRNSEESVEAAEAAVAEAADRRDQALADLDSTEVKRNAEREVLVSELPAELLALYDRIRENKGVGAGPLQGQRCGACRLELDRSALSEVREAAEDDVVRCQECGAILVRVVGANR